MLLPSRPGPKLLVSDWGTFDKPILRWRLRIWGNLAVEFGVVPLSMVVEVLLALCCICYVIHFLCWVFPCSRDRDTLGRTSKESATLVTYLPQLQPASCKSLQAALVCVEACQSTMRHCTVPVQHAACLSPHLITQSLLLQLVAHNKPLLLLLYPPL